MYARYFTFKGNPDVGSDVEALADQAYGIMKSLQGFVSAHILISEDENEYGSFSLWESRQDAESGGETVRSKTSEVIQKLAAEPPTVRIYKIYKPR